MIKHFMKMPFHIQILIILNIFLMIFWGIQIFFIPDYIPRIKYFGERPNGIYFTYYEKVTFWDMVKSWRKEK